MCTRICELGFRALISMAEGHLHSKLQDSSCASGETKSKLLPPKESVSGSQYTDQFGGNDCSQGDSPVASVISMKSEESIVRSIKFKGYLESTRVDLDWPDSLSSSSCGPALNTPGEAHSDHTTEDAHIRCDVCSKIAVKSCLTCMASYCELHVRQHYSTPALQRHKLVEATEDLEERLCQRHGMKLELYCRTDQTAICGLCVPKGHTGHDITDLEEHQEMQRKKSEIEKQTAIPPPGPIEFTSVTPDSVCLRWGPPEGLTGPHRFRVSWLGEDRQERLEVEDLKLYVRELHAGEKYTFTVATLSDGIQSPCVTATIRTDIPSPDCLTVDVDLTSVSVTFRKPAGVDLASYLLTLCSEGESLQTVSIRSLQHCFSELAFERDYSISVSTALKGRQSKPTSKSIRTSIPVPENVTVDSTTPLSADFSWSLHQGMEQIPHSFLISYHSEGTEPQTISTESCSKTLTGLQPNNRYTVSVCCELRDGRKSQATLVTIQTGSFKPEGLSVTALKEESYARGEWSAELSWSQPQWSDQSSYRFKITYQSGIGPNTIAKTTNADSYSTALTGLQADTEYTATVSTVLQDGRESDPASVTFHTSERRILLLGKSGDGKSSTGNTILGETVFDADGCQDSVTAKCETQSRIINGRKYTVTDTPGLFDTIRSEDKLIPEIAKCIFDSAPGPHAFIIVMKKERFTKQQEEVLQKIKGIFAEDTFKHALIVFTHGRDLKNQTIEEFVGNSGGTDSSVQRKTHLKKFVEQCNGHYHAIDNEHWNQEEGENSNRIQLDKLFDTIEDIVQKNGCYSNDFSLLVVQAIQREMERMMKHERGLSDRDIREKAKTRVERKVLLNKCAATCAAWLYAAFGSPKFASHIDRAAATTTSPNEAIKEYCRLLNILKEP